MQTIELADGRIELSAYPVDKDVLVNINVDGVCVHQIRLENVAGADFDALKANGMVIPHVIPVGDAEAFLAHARGNSGHLRDG